MIKAAFSDRGFFLDSVQISFITGYRICGAVTLMCHRNRTAPIRSCFQVQLLRLPFGPDMSSIKQVLMTRRK